MAIKTGIPGPGSLAFLALAAAAAVGVLLWSRATANGTTIARDVGQSLGQTGAALVLDGAAGVVEGIGKAVGIPVTNETACEKAKREGRTWDASFDCPAGDFLKYLWS